MKTTNNPSYFEENYIDYNLQNPEHKLDFYKSILDRYLSKSSNVIDFGCGLGAFLRSCDETYNLIGIDPNSEAIKSNRLSLSNNIDLYTGSYESLVNIKLKNEQQVDAITAWDVLEHVPDLDMCLNTIHSKLSENGYLIIVVPTYDGILGPIVSLLDKDPTHVWKRGYDFWLKKLESKSFRIIDTGGILRKLVFKNYIHITRPKLILKYFRSSIWIVARK